MASKAYVSSMTVAELKAELNKRGMNTRGRKTELQDRLEMALYAEEDSESGSESGSGEPDREQMVKQVLASIVTPTSGVEGAATDFGTFPVSIDRSGLGAKEEEEEEEQSKEERTEQLIVSIEHSRRITSSSQPTNLSQTTRSRRRRQRLNGGVAPSRAMNERDPVLQQQQESLPPVIKDSIENGEELGQPAAVIEKMAVQEQSTTTILAACENMVRVDVATTEEMVEAQQTSQEPVCSTSPVLPPDEQDNSASIPTASQSPPQSAQEEEVSGVTEQLIGERGDGQDVGQQEFVEEAASEQIRTDPSIEEYQNVPPTDPPTEEYQNLPPTDPPTEEYQNLPPVDPPTEEYQNVPPIDPPTEECQYVPPTDPPAGEWQYVPPAEPPAEECRYVLPIDPPMEECQYVLPTDPPTEECQYLPPTDQPAQDEETTAMHTEIETDEELVQQQTVNKPALAETSVEVASIPTPPAEECVQETATASTEDTKPVTAVEIEQETVEELCMQEKPTESPDSEQQPMGEGEEGPDKSPHLEQQSMREGEEGPDKSPHLEQLSMGEGEEEKIPEGLGIQEVSGEEPAAEEFQATSIPELTEQNIAAVEDESLSSNVGSAMHMEAVITEAAIEDMSLANDGGSATHMEDVITEANVFPEPKSGGDSSEPAGETMETTSGTSKEDSGEKVGSDGVRVLEEEEGVEGQGQRVSADPAPIELDVVVHTVEEDDFSVFSAEASEAQNLDTSTVTTQPATSSTNDLSSSAAINPEGSVDNDSRNRKRASSLLSDKDRRESSTESQPDSLKRRRISTSPKCTQERRRRWGSSSRSQHTSHAVITSDTLQGIIPDSIRDSVTETLEGSSALEAVMAYGEVEEKVEEDVLDIGKNDTLMDEYEHEWEEKEKERAREKEEQRKEAERARKELETRRRIEARMKAKKEGRQGRLSSSEDTREGVVQRSPSPARNPATPNLHLENLTRPFTLRQLKDLLEEDGPMIEKGFWTNKIKSHCIALYTVTESAVATRQRLHNLKWPSTNPKLLKADFLTAQEVFSISDGQLTVSSPPPSKSSATKSSPKREEVIAGVVYETEEPKEREEKMEVDTKPEEPSVTEEAVSSAKQEVFPNKESPKATKVLDDLFRKTKTVPCIYWLPLTEEQATKKEAEQKAWEAERELRREERRKERELELEKERQRQQEQEREANRERRERDKRLQEEQKRRSRERMRRRRSWSRSRSRSRDKRRR